MTPDENGNRAPVILDGTNGVIPIMLKFVAYQSISKEDLNTITSGLCDTNRNFATKVMNTALKNNGKVTIPLLEASLCSVPSEKSKAITKEQIFKLPNSEYIKCGFIDRREELKQDVRDTIGQSVIPETLSRYIAPARGIIYDSYGTSLTIFLTIFLLKTKLSINLNQKITTAIATEGLLLAKSITVCLTKR